jgi:hypothetical protein
MENFHQLIPVATGIALSSPLQKVDNGVCYNGLVRLLGLKVGGDLTLVWLSIGYYKQGTTKEFQPKNSTLEKQ